MAFEDTSSFQSLLGEALQMRPRPSEEDGIDGVDVEGRVFPLSRPVERGARALRHMKKDNRLRDGIGLGHGGLLLVGGLRNVAPTPTLRAVMVVGALAVFTFGYQFFLVSIVTKPPSFLPCPGYGGRGFRAETITVTQFPIFPLCMHHVAYGQLGRSQSLP